MKIIASTSIQEISVPTLPFFKGENYDRWCVKMKTLFRYQNLWKIVEQGISTTGSKVEKLGNKKKDARALYLIQQAIDEHIFDRIIGLSTAKEA